MDREEIKKLVRGVLAEMRPAEAGSPGRTSSPSGEQGPRVLILFGTGVRRLEEALAQVRLSEAAAGKSGVYTAEPARGLVCPADVKGKTGARCILDTVNLDGLNKVMERADVLVLPTFCLKVAAKVARLICDDPISDLIFSALLQGKKVLASRDGFMVCDILTNVGIREEIDQILKKLEGFGMVLCPTEQLSELFVQITTAGQGREAANRQETPAEETGSPLKLITAKVITRAVDNKAGTLRLAPGGVVTPLARDLAGEYSIRIIET
jgi:hypothetical protein